MTLIPQYIGNSFVDNLGRTVFAPELGAPLLVALIAYVVVRGGYLWDVDPLVVLLAGSAVLFAAMTALTRAGLGIELASGSRYTYAVIALLLPLSAIALSRIVAIGTAGVAVVLTFIVLVGSYNAGMLIEQANVQASLEQDSHRIVSATLATVVGRPERRCARPAPGPGRHAEPHHRRDRRPPRARMVRPRRVRAL